MNDDLEEKERVQKKRVIDSLVGDMTFLMEFNANHEKEIE
jgi:hypothetical protein